MVDISAISGLMTALRGAADITKAMIDLRDGAMIQSKVIELQSAILAAQGQAFTAHDERAALVARVSELEKEMAGLKAWETEKQNYELTDIGQGVLAYAMKDGVQGTGPAHKICANCYGEGHKSLLQPQVTDVGRWDYFQCKRCNATYWPHGGGDDYLGRRPATPPRGRR